jgi:hypothetical protein
LNGSTESIDSTQLRQVDEVAKSSSIPLPTGSGKKRFLTVLVLLVLVVLVVRYPADSAAAVKSAAGIAGAAVDGVVTSVRAVSN